MVRKLFIATGMCATLLSGMNLAKYYGTPGAEDFERLGSLAAYVRNYDGDDPYETMEFTRLELSELATRHPDLPELSVLEHSVKETSERLGPDAIPEDYRPYLNVYAENMYDISRQNSPRIWDLVAGLAFGFAAVINLMNPYNWTYKKQKRGAKQEEEEKPDE